MERKEDCEVSTGRYRKSSDLNEPRQISYDHYVANLSWIRFERAPYIPQNFVAIGDSVMRPNPTFGWVFIVFYRLRRADKYE